MIYDIIINDIKQAMLEKDTIKRDCLRSIISEIKNQTVNAGKEINEDICLKVLQKAVKQRDDAIESFKTGGRQDLTEKETKEKEIIQKYLPKMLSEEETKVIIAEILKNIEPLKKNIGLIMKQLPSNVDKKIASKLIQSLLK